MFVNVFIQYCAMTQKFHRKCASAAAFTCGGDRRYHREVADTDAVESREDDEVPDGQLVRTGFAVFIRINHQQEVSDNYMYKAFCFLGIKAKTKHQVHYHPRKVRDLYPNLIFTPRDAKTTNSRKLSEV